MRKVLARTRNGSNSERGSILPFAVIGMLTFVLSAGLAIDISHAYATATELQNAADAAALAGVTALDHTALGIAEAANRATAVMNKYDLSTSVTLDSSNIKFGANLTDFDNGLAKTVAAAQTAPQNMRFVQVTIPDRAIGVTLATSVLGSSMTLTRSAIAGQSVGVNPCDDWSKVVLLEAAGSNAAQGLYGACAEDQLELVTPGACSNNTVYTPGCVYNVHLSPPCDPHTKEYMVIDNENKNFDRYSWTEQTAISMRGNYNAFTGATVSGCNWIGQELLIEPHIDAANVRDAFNCRFNQYTGSLSSSQFPPDKITTSGINYTGYKGAYTTSAASNAGVSDRRVIVMPIMKLDQWNWRDDPSLGWIGTVKIDRFGVFFLQRKVSGSNSSTADFRLEAISDSVVLGDGAAGVSANSQLTVPVLYR